MLETGPSRQDDFRFTGKVLGTGCSGAVLAAVDRGAEAAAMADEALMAGGGVGTGTAKPAWLGLVARAGGTQPHGDVVKAVRELGSPMLDDAYDDCSAYDSLMMLMLMLMVRMIFASGGLLWFIRPHPDVMLTGTKRGNL